MESQSLLLSEPVYSQTSFCCEKSHVQRPSSPKNRVCSPDVHRDTPYEVQMPDPDSLKSRFKRLFTFSQDECEGVPLVCWGRLEK
jgi:hypothetical protein